MQKSNNHTFFRCCAIQKRNRNCKPVLT